MNPSRVYVNVDLDAICKNVQNAMDRVGPDVKMMAVIKTDGYGHGAVPIAKALNKIGVYAYAIATIDEAVELRGAGVENPLLILGHVFENDLKTALECDVTLTVFAVENARVISKVAGEMGKTAKVHIKLDTGMGRLGFLPYDKSAEEIAEIFEMPNIEVEGVFSHFATADETDKTFANSQAEKYGEFVELLESRGMKFELKHLCNSAGIIDLSGENDNASANITDTCDVKYNMVRSGIMTYGLYPSEEVVKENVVLKPALSLISHVAFVKEVDSGFAVSYGSTYVTSGKTKIATIPVGYGDGYPRSLSNKGRVLIGGEYAPIIGRVCMDQFMVDVTHIPNVKQGDEVVLVGVQGDKRISVEEVADLAGSFNYEFVCGINKRVPRVYEGGDIT